MWIEHVGYLVRSCAQTIELFTCKIYKYKMSAGGSADFSRHFAV